MSKKKRFVLFLAIISLFVSLNMVEKTYAKYVTETTGSASLNIARWDIVVNDEHIKDNQSLTAELTPNYVENPNVAAGVIAPGSIGYFDITIDPENTDVSFSFDITVDETEDSNVTDLEVLKYYIDSEDNLVNVDNSFTSISDTITIDNKVSKTVRIYIIWNDNQETENMNNDNDSAVGHDTENSKASVKVNLTFKQTL